MTAAVPLASLHPAELDLLRRDDLTVDDIADLPEDLHFELIDGRLVSTPYVGIPSYWIIDPLAERVSFTQFGLGPDGVYERRLQTDGVVTVNQPWEITLDLPAWTRKRDRIRRVARRDR